MCSIFSVFGKYDYERCVKSFEKTSYRGPDDTRYIKVSDSVLLGFHRLSIMGLSSDGMQPFERNGIYSITNGELYGFRSEKEKLIKKGYAFRSGSDCEILIPMYMEYGLDMFKMLDAEYATVIYDSKTGDVIASRDQIGIRPLFYGSSKDGSYGFSSEAKALIDLFDDVIPFPPGHYFKNGEFIEYEKISEAESYSKDSFDETIRKIHDKLEDGVIKRLDSDAPLGFLLSGGLDSSLVCAIAAKHLSKPIKTYSIGMNTDAIDLKYAKEVADYLGSEHHEIIMTKEDVFEALEDVIRTLETYDITTIRASIGMYLLLKGIRKISDIKVVMTGEISDELFGYKYTDFAPSSDEFQKEAEKRIRELYMYDVLRADRCISRFSFEARVPFGDLDFVRYVMSIDPKMKMNTYGKGKFLLRKAFEGDYLPSGILYREKAAFSDAVGHSMVDYLKEYAETLYTDEEFESIKKKYSYHSEPFTKESLMYREIFEKFYKGKAKWIKDYWMPNKEWKGCDVNDPSARVLSNYGDSAI